MVMRRKRVHFIQSCLQYLLKSGPTTTIELIDNVRNNRGKKYHGRPSVSELGQLLRMDKRFVVVGLTTESISLWSLADELAMEEEE